MKHVLFGRPRTYQGTTEPSRLESGASMWVVAAPSADAVRTHTHTREREDTL